MKSRYRRNEHGMLSQCNQELLNHCLSQSGKALPDFRAGQNISDFGEDFFGNAEFNDSQLSEEQTGSRGTFSPGSALQEDHAIEDYTGLRGLGAHRFSGGVRLL